jgi:hypothetical protein
MKRVENTSQAAVTTGNAATFRTGVNRTNITVNTGAITAAIAPEPASYSLSDLQFRIVRYLIPTEFYQSLSNTLGNEEIINYGIQIIGFILAILYLQQIKIP